MKGGGVKRNPKKKGNFWDASAAKLCGAHYQKTQIRCHASGSTIRKKQKKKKQEKSEAW